MTSWHFDLFALCLLISSTACLGASRSAQSCTSIKREEKELKVLTLFLCYEPIQNLQEDLVDMSSFYHVLDSSPMSMCVWCYRRENTAVSLGRSACKRFKFFPGVATGLVVPWSSSAGRETYCYCWSWSYIIFNWITGSSKFSKTTNHKKKWDDKTKTYKD